MIAEHAAIFAHLPADRADFMISRGVKQPGKDNEGGGDIFHGKSRLVVRHQRDDRALTRRANQAQINTIEDYMARAANPAAGFLLAAAESCNAGYDR